MTECAVYLCGKGENYLISCISWHLHIVHFLFCKLSARGCSAGQEGGNFFTSISYALRCIRLYSLLEGYSFLDSAFPQNKITLTAHTIVTGDGSILLCWDSSMCIYMYMDNICCTYKTYLYFTCKTLIWFSLFTSCSNLVGQCLLLSICLYQNVRRETIWNGTPSNAIIDRKPGNTKGF